MNDKRIDAMEAGPEMDRAVAEVVFSTFVPAGRYGLETAEMIAADRAASEKGDYYIVAEQCYGDRDIITRAPTGPLAICRAILKIQHQK